ncbi:hypothetical protein [Clostridium tyrobutyricum]|uniref:hypothetical protein n=1 Tax=Clostridium tyrobutyricum TaxID=1519 RepID=UPI001C38E7A3|nr:hypothetical protein [Clostridium tyrobutyricum]MBV4417082.1 hypothetical protein [Clostridium tyrobutyricum]
MDIFFRPYDKRVFYQLPIVPESVPEISMSAKNEEFEGVNGNYNMLGNAGLQTFGIDCWLPEYPNKYTQPWCKVQINPYLIINLWAQAMSTKKPLKCIIVRGANKNNISPILLDWWISVESLTHSVMQNLDISYKVSFKRYELIGNETNLLQ